MVTVAHALCVLSESTQNASNILLWQLINFTVLCSWLKRNILLIYPSTQQPQHVPPILPREARTFLGSACSMEMEDIEACWNAVKDLAWEGEEILGGVRGTEGLQQTFREHGGLMYRA
ncbi:hypothetical protein K435DRAFT_656317 [Dendrothele bispora CBS 962.96]|uniref:Uncharacterized protein n=1 Tax=Dendrothele bispora (strain CBS 962.96) TaxID=1314807 RepID=A0A4S8MEN7_DENBC|nr:hypothetical protein K435DRAFT_656317 [Dendrothele bispora CBS 962.96]